MNLISVNQNLKAIHNACDSRLFFVEHESNISKSKFESNPQPTGKGNSSVGA